MGEHTLTLDHLRSLVARIHFPALEFQIVAEDGTNYTLHHCDAFGWRPHLRVRCPNGVDNMTGEEGYAWSGRKWPLSFHMTDGEVVQTAFLALMTALEHEARERFTFLGTPVFDPHYDIHKLVALRRSGGAIKERR